MSSQKNDREEVFIEQTSYDDQRTTGAYNAIYDYVRKKYNDPGEYQLSMVNSSLATERTDLFNDRESEPSSINIRIPRNTKEISKTKSKLQENMHKSREIHRQLMNKKHRWRPSELELTVLKLHFEKNKYPSKEEKEAILKNLETNLRSNIDMSQLNRWFQHEREKETKHGLMGNSKSTYKKFKQEDLDYLKERFTENTYPKTEEMIEMSKKLKVNLSKIENWYKHNRRSLAKRGCFTLKTKKYFKKDEVSYLLKMFDLYPRPTKEQILEMGQHLNCNELQIKNWYSNKRKKQKVVAKRQGAESQERMLHQMAPPIYLTQSVPSSELFNNFQMNIETPVIPIRTMTQSGEQTHFMQNPVSNRTLNPAQPVQIANSFYPNSTFVAGTNSINTINGLNNVNGMVNINGATAMYPGAQIINNGTVFPNGTIPMIVIPAQNLNMPVTLPTNQTNPQMGQLGQLGQLGQMGVQEADLKKLSQPQPLLFNNNMVKGFQPPANTGISSFPMVNNFPQTAFQSTLNQFQPNINLAPNQISNYNFFKQSPSNQSGIEIGGGNWLFPGQGIQSSNPVIIVNKQPTMQNQQVPFNIQGQPVNFIQTNDFNSGTFISNTFPQANTGVPRIVSYEQPMQIQYLTSLYCPYSNNNIFSGTLPTMVQSTPNYQMQTPDKP